MKKPNKLIDTTLIVTTLVCLIPLIFSAIVYTQLPDQIPIHFNISGEPDNYASKAFGAFGMPLLLALLNIVVQLVLKTDPKRDTASKLYKISRWTIPVLTLFISPLTLLLALGEPIRVEKVVPLMISILFLVIGNYLPKIKQNYTVGIKLPWTLASETNWKKTHRLAGWIWIICSLIFIVTIFFNFYIAWVFFGGLVIMVGVPLIYSFVLGRKEEAESTAAKETTENQ